MNQKSPKQLIVSIGHTAAGKTTLLKYMSDKLDIPYISEGAIKRSMLVNYTSNNSLDENLRDIGYAEALKISCERLSRLSSVIIDASFHRLFRRLWVYETFDYWALPFTIYWMYCHCDNAKEIERRIALRAKSECKTADNQADSMLIYNHIINDFDEVNITNFPGNIPTKIYEIDTFNNILVSTDYNSAFKKNNFDDLLNHTLCCYLNDFKK